MSKDPTPQRRWRHKVRGTGYAVLNHASVQASTRPLVDGDSVTVYCGVDSKWYVRLVEEFYDGRFEEIKDPAA